MFKKVELGFELDALEPFIDKETVDIHYNKHHQAYVDKLNSIVSEKQPSLFNYSLEEIFKNFEEVDEDIKESVWNNGLQIINHNLFWSILSPLETNISDKLMKGIETDFGSLELMQEEFNSKSASVFGSGWVFLSVDDHGRLVIDAKSNANNPIVENKTPILGLDVWEHAYYLKYQNRRVEYINNFWKIVNWSEVSNIYKGCKK